MRIPVVLALVCLLLQVATDVYLFFIAWQRSRRLTAAKIQLWTAAFFLVYAIVLFFIPKKGADDAMLRALTWLIFIYVTVYLGKVIFVIFDLIAQLPRLWHRNRCKGITVFGAVMGALVFLACWWGALINRYQLDVNEVTIHVKDLPKSFRGYRIAQISDLHVGTYGSDTTFVSKLVDKVNELKPDMIVFTGDIVNRHTEELEPFVKPLSRLDARDGVFSILGNHDYGDYYQWPNEHAKELNMEKLMDMQIGMGWELLTNSSEVIYGDVAGDSIVVIGVENWGDPPFPTYGNLSDAYPTPSDSATKVLLTHNPVHWVEQIAPADTMNIALTLSGHTHAMQMKVGPLSPAAWRYKTWGGLYDSDDGKRKLYVNIGTGTVGTPMRLGATPEITVFTLIPDK